MPYHCYISWLLICIITSGCNNVETRIETADSLAMGTGLTKTILQTKLFKLVSYKSVLKQNAIATVYIEGDGLAWLSRNRVSSNPTPINPVALKLALIDNTDNVIYIARPCQYVDLTEESQCISDYWTTKRIALEVINSFGEAIDQVKQQNDITKIRLVGFSGGGTVAAILAATRDDVVDLRTVAANLDIDQFTETHKVSRMLGSINPIKYSKTLSRIPQIHFTGRLDKVILSAITESYINQLKVHDANLKCVQTIQVDDASHTKGWELPWGQYSNLMPKCI